jgi:hypothetical protein
MIGVAGLAAQSHCWMPAFFRYKRLDHGVAIKTSRIIGGNWCCPENKHRENDKY